MPPTKRVMKVTSASKSDGSAASSSNKSSSANKRSNQKRKADDNPSGQENPDESPVTSEENVSHTKKVSKKSSTSSPSAGMQAKLAQETALVDYAASFLRGFLSGGAAATSNSPSPPAAPAAAPTAASAEDIRATLQEALDLSKSDRIFQVGQEVGPIGSAGITALATLLSTAANEALAKKVTNFVLTDHKIGDEGAATLASLLSKFPNLDLINLSFNNITAQGLKTLAAALPQLTKLKRLCLNYNPFGDAGVRIVCEAWLESPRPSKIETLMFGGCGLTYNDSERLKVSLRDWFPKLQELDCYNPRQR